MYGVVCGVHQKRGSEREGEKPRGDAILYYYFFFLQAFTVFRRRCRNARGLLFLTSGTNIGCK